MQLWEAIVLGIVQGLTEFLPVSSTAHLLVVRRLMGHPHPEDAFTTAIQLGTLVAVFWYFRADVARLLRALMSDIRAMRPGTTLDARLGWKIVAGTVPVVICGLAFKHFIKDRLYNLEVIALAAIFFALLLLAAEILRKGRPGRVEDDISWRDAILIGCFQALALIPGASRSGVTITAGLFVGLSRPASARFSFLLSLPSVLGAGLKETYDEHATLFQSGGDTLNLVVGTAVAGIVGYWSIAWLLGYLKGHATYRFVIYRLILGVTILALLATGWLKNTPKTDAVNGSPPPPSAAGW